jgi:hypothetical protein
MRIIEKVTRFVQKPLPDQWAAIKATLSNGDAFTGLPAHTPRRRCYVQPKRCTSRIGQTLTPSMSAILR